jgi:rubrerythrin
MVLEPDFSRLDARDTLDIAIVIEDEAKLAYEHLAEWVRSDGNAEAADFFERMADLEERHKQAIVARRELLFGDAPVRHDEAAPWQAEVPDYEALGREVGIEDAFDVAIDAETRAHDFYNGALDYVDDPQIVELFEWLKKAEIEHKRLINDERERHRSGVNG